MTTYRVVTCVAALTSLASADVGESARNMPDTRPAQVKEAIRVSQKLATPQIDAALLLSLMWGESRFDPSVRTGRVCGIMQVNPSDIGRPRSDCNVWSRDVEAGVRAGIIELQMMLADRRVRGDIRRTLMYRACGNSAFDGTCRKGAWVNAVLYRAKRLRGKVDGEKVGS